MTTKRGTNQFKKKYSFWKIYLWIYFTVVFCIIAVALANRYHPKIKIISPMGRISSVAYAQEIIPTPDPLVQIDKWIGEYVDTFARTANERSLWRYQLHCVAFHESTHHESKVNGDQGIALGLFQYHMATWIGFRKLMIKANWTNFIGDPYDDRTAIATTAWAWSTGRQGDWGTWKDCNK